MIEARTEYDYGTAAIELAFYTPKPAPAAPLYARELRRMRRMDRIERLHLLKQRIEITKARRWVFKRYPQHFALMP
jgi:hypothetical protein